MRKALISLSLLVLPLSSMAASSVVITVTGELYAPTTCSLSQPPDIDFGNVLTTGIDNVEYEKPVDMRLDCQNRNPLQSVNVQIDVPGAAANLIPVSGAEGFELALKMSGAAQNLNTPIRMDQDGPLNLTLTPVKKAGEDYKLGQFTATATVVVSVQ
ncbi:fimbrial protein [Serratia quinivorans]|uniref:fimbrial protein n=1 Tax=Serratia quinivorans TaxID=137545 RepID=UPI00217C767F|nr:fimbrial protein [Serratia quinivorans]CAI0968319.1 putative minor fimbrial subunit StfF [Serratia quinivorans]CAI1713149.1 putative minor fimbrial subunit StfF [Serratia quinivorans]